MENVPTRTITICATVFAIAYLWINTWAFIEAQRNQVDAAIKGKTNCSLTEELQIICSKQ